MSFEKKLAFAMEQYKTRNAEAARKRALPDSRIKRAKRRREPRHTYHQYVQKKRQFLKLNSSEQKKELLFQIYLIETQTKRLVKLIEKLEVK